MLSILGGEAPLQILLELVSLPMFQDLVVLEAADHDARPDTDGLREVINLLARQRLAVKSQELGERLRRDERVGREAVGFLLVLRHVRVNDLVAHLLCRVVDHERLQSTMQKDVGDFVEEGEPKLVIRLVPDGEADEGVLFVEPPGAAADPRARQFRHEHDGNPGPRADRDGLFQGLADLLSRQPPQLLQRRPQPGLVEVRKLQLGRLDLGFANPRRDGFLPGVEHLRLAEGDRLSVPL